jgi:carotenoid cleavage dioxygenase-like enzyme
MQGPPVMGGLVGAMFNTLMRVDLTGGPPEALVLAPNECLSEPAQVPSDRPGHQGWLLTIVNRQCDRGQCHVPAGIGVMIHDELDR